VELNGNRENILTNPRIEEIIEALKELRSKLDEIDGVAKDLDGILDPDTFAKIKDFLRDHRGEQMTEADQKLKDIEAELAKLEKRLREVNGNNEDFMRMLNHANDSPDDKERIALIMELLGESNDDAKKPLQGIKADKDKIKEMIENMRNTLRSKSAAEISLQTVLEIIADSEKTNEQIQARLADLDRIEGEIEERKKRWIQFDAAAQGNRALIGEFLGRLKGINDLYEENCK